MHGQMSLSANKVPAIQLDHVGQLHRILDLANDLVHAWLVDTDLERKTGAGEVRLRRAIPQS